MRKYLLCSVCLLLIIFTPPIFAQFNERSPQIEKVTNGEIDWANEYFYASGEGIIPPSSEEPNPAKAQLKAKNYAKMAAIANLYIAIENTTITCKGAGKDYMAMDMQIRQSIEGHISNVEIVSEKRITQGSDTIIEVTVRAPMYGYNGLAMPFLASRNVAMASGGISINQSSLKSSISSPRNPSDAGKYTSVIIDCSGLRLKRAINPRIRRIDGTEIWGKVNINSYQSLDKGMVAYSTSMFDAKDNDRAGSNPLIIRAIGKAGNSKMECDPVVSNDDASAILSNNASSKYLDKLDVVFAI